MKTSKNTSTPQKFKKRVLDARSLFAIPKNRRYSSLILNEYSFDEELLSLSSLYRKSRTEYLALGGGYSAKVCSVMRSLSAQDLFVDQIEFSPVASELKWFTEHSDLLADPQSVMQSLMEFNGISLFHEQNHRILWRLLPPSPSEKEDVRRYLNFAESLVVVLDLALGDEVGPKYSPLLEDFKAIYRPSGKFKKSDTSKSEYRQYLFVLFYVTYLALELIAIEDIPKAVNYIFPKQKKMNREAITRGLELSELFTQNTNRQWQEKNWKSAAKNLSQLQKDSPEDILYIPEDPLDLEEEFIIASRIFAYFGL